MELEIKHVDLANVQKQVKVHAPGTVANLVCGFDVLGMCLNAPYDIMEVRVLEEKKITIVSKDGYQLPTDPAQNTAGAPLKEMLHELDGPVGFEETIEKRIKPGSGIGSGAARAAGPAAAAKNLLGSLFLHHAREGLPLF